MLAQARENHRPQEMDQSTQGKRVAKCIYIYKRKTLKDLSAVWAWKKQQQQQKMKGCFFKFYRRYGKT